MILRTYRRLNVLSQEKLATILGYDKTYISMIETRLAELARSAGRVTEAINELWPLVTRLEARAAAGQLERATVSVLGEAWVSLGVCLGTAGLPRATRGPGRRGEGPC
jgi:hypothetical protein